MTREISSGGTTIFVQRRRTQLHSVLCSYHWTLVIPIVADSVVNLKSSTLWYTVDPVAAFHPNYAVGDARRNATKLCTPFYCPTVNCVCLSDCKHISVLSFKLKLPIKHCCTKICEDSKTLSSWVCIFQSPSNGSCFYRLFCLAYPADARLMRDHWEMTLPRSARLGQAGWRKSFSHKDWNSHCISLKGCQYIQFLYIYTCVSIFFYTL